MPLEYPPWWSECCSPRQSFLEAVLPRAAMACGYWLLWTSTTFASLYAVCGFLHLQACCQCWVQNGSPTPHKKGCKLTLEFQLFLFSASGHFHVGIGSSCEKGLWRRMYLEKPIFLGQSPGPALSFPLEDFVGNLCTWHLGLERESQGGQPDPAANSQPCSF